MSFVRKHNFSNEGLCVALVVAVCLLLTGCGNDLAQVTGTITVDGQPLQTADDVKVTILFQPESGGAPATGLVDTNGQYTLSTGGDEGITPGEYLVTCAVTQLIPPATPGGTPGGRRISDPKYANAATSGLRLSVKAGDNQYDIALNSPQKR